MYVVSSVNHSHIHFFTNKFCFQWSKSESIGIHKYTRISYWNPNFNRPFNKKITTKPGIKV